MQSLLRQIVAGPRARHSESNLDLCYVTEKIIATSGPSATYPSLAYRNPLNELVAFLDSRHGENWCIWEFRAEGTGYPDEEVHGRIWHFPWPDHHPPPFALVPKIMASMRNWLHTETADSGTELEKKQERVVVVHCKAGKGRSGSMAISYLITHEGWKKADALQRFTERRMRPNFGNGISIPSQLRWIDYVERWSGEGGRMYVERPVEVTEVHVWGLRDGVKISVEGYVEEGRKIKNYHVFDRSERDDFSKLDEHREGRKDKASFTDIVSEVVASRLKNKPSASSSPTRGPADGLAPLSTTGVAGSDMADSPSSATTPVSASGIEPSTNTIFRPSKPIILESSDINLAVERRAGWNTVTSVAHVWFNCFFEGNGPEKFAASKQTLTSNTSVSTTATTADSTSQAPTNPARGADEHVPPGSPWAAPSGVFEITWDAMDGIKGSSRKGTRAFDRVAVVWRAVADVPAEADAGANVSSTTGQDSTTTQHTAAEGARGRQASIIPEPQPGEYVASGKAANWRGSEPVLATADGAGDGEDGVAEEEAKTGKTPAEGGSDSEDADEGIRRGVLT